MWQQCHLEAKVRLQLLLALLRSQGNSELPPTGLGFLIQILEGTQKGKEIGGGAKPLPFVGAPVKSCLLFLSVSCVWLEPLRVGTPPSQTNVHTSAIWSHLKASQGPSRSSSNSSSWRGSSSSRRKSCLIKKAESSRLRVPLDQSPLPRGERQPPQGGRAAWQERERF